MMRLKSALETRFGYEPTVLVRDGEETRWVKKISSGPDLSIRQIFRDHIRGNLSGKGNTHFSAPYVHNAFNIKKNFDTRDCVINLHWVSTFLSPKNIAELGTMGVPLVWTMHDEAAFTGGCHYTAGCRAFENDCQPCFQLADDSLRIPHQTLLHRRELLPPHMVVVTPSNWLAGQVRASHMFRDHRVEVIPYSLDLNNFKPGPGSDFRKRYGIPDNCFLILFGAVTGGEKRKGLHLLLQLLEILTRDARAGELIKKGEMRVVTFGRDADVFRESGVQTHHAGFIEREAALAGVYQACDLFVLPSLEDNLPNTMLESLACGTPVLSFRTGGIPEGVEHGKNGLLAEPGDAEQMAALLKEIWFNPDERKKMGRYAADSARNRYQHAQQAEAYHDLFSELLREQAKGAFRWKTDRELSLLPDLPAGIANMHRRISLEKINFLMKNQNPDKDGRRTIGAFKKQLKRVAGFFGRKKN